MLANIFKSAEMARIHRKPPKFLSQISEFLMLKAVFSHLKREAQ